jgi:cytochrome P450
MCLFAACLLVFGVPLLWLVWALHRAPEGYEDQTGFHPGRPDR